MRDHRAAFVARPAPPIRRQEQDRASPAGRRCRRELGRFPNLDGRDARQLCTNHVNESRQRVVGDWPRPSHRSTHGKKSEHKSNQPRQRCGEQRERDECRPIDRTCHRAGCLFRQLQLRKAGDKSIHRRYERAFEYRCVAWQGLWTGDRPTCLDMCFCDRRRSACRAAFKCPMGPRQERQRSERRSEQQARQGDSAAHRRAAAGCEEVKQDRRARDGSDLQNAPHEREADGGHRGPSFRDSFKTSSNTDRSFLVSLRSSMSRTSSCSREPPKTRSTRSPKRLPETSSKVFAG